MLKPIAILLFLSMAYGADDSKKPPFAEEAFNRVVDASASEAAKAYSDYLTKLDAANKRVLAGLEVIKKDLNDTNKNKGMSIQERAEAIKSIEEKIATVKRDGVGEAVVGKIIARADPQGERTEGSRFIGTWVINANKHNGIIVAINEDKTANWGNRQNGQWTITDGKCIITWSNGFIYTISIDKNRLSFAESKNNAVIATGSLDRSTGK